MMSKEKTGIAFNMKDTKSIKIRRINTMVFVNSILWLAGMIAVQAQSFQKPELIVETGHSDTSYSVALSPDGRIFASAGDDNVIRLWDLQTGRELAELKGHTNDVKAVTFSSNGKILASGSWDKTVKIWDIRKRIEIDTFKADSDILTLRFSPNGKMLAAVESEDKFKIWNLETRREILAKKKFKSKSVFVAFSRDGNSLAFADENAVINLLNIQTGQIIRSYEGHDSLVATIVFSADGSRLVSGDFEGFIKFWDVKSGAELKTIPAHENYVSSIIFRADGKQFLSSSGDHQIKLWDAETNQVIRTFKGHENDVSSIDVGRDWKTIISASEDEKIKIWNLETGEERQTITGRADEISELAFSPDGKTMALFSQLGDLKLWQINTGREVISYKKGLFGKFVFSHDGSLLAFEGEHKEIVIVKIETGRVLRVLKGYAYFNSFAFSPNNKILASGGTDGIVRLWSVETGDSQGIFEGHTKSVSAIDFDAKGDFLASVDEDQFIRIWDLQQKKETKRIENVGYQQRLIKFSPDGKLLATSGYDKEVVKIFDIASGKTRFPLAGHKAYVQSVSFSPDGKILASGSYNKEIKLWNVQTGQEIPFNKLPEWVRLNAGSVAVANFNGRMIRAEKDNQIVRIKNADDGQELIQLIALDEKDWMAATPDGLFDGTPNAWKQLIWRFNNDTFDYAAVETFFNEFFRPNLLREIIEGKQPKAPSDFARIDRRQLEVEINFADNEVQSNMETRLLITQVQVEATEMPAETRLNALNKNKPKPNGEVRDLRLFRNGSLVKIWHGETIKEIVEQNKSDCYIKSGIKNKGRTIICKTNVPIVAGENIFTAYAFNRDNVKSADDTAKIEGKFPKKDGTLYVLAIGIDKYINPNFNLPFSVSGIEQISKAIKEHQDQLTNDSEFKQYARTEIITLKDETATKENISEALKRFSTNSAEKSLPDNLCDKLSESQCFELRTELSKVKPARPEDTLIIHFLGHGTSLDERFYFLPHNFPFDGDNDSYITQAVSDIELNRWLEQIDAERLLMIIDACRSGQALGEESAGQAPMNSKGLAQLAYDKGMIILTASQNVQKANQTEKINGRRFESSLLSYALRDGFTKPEADKNNDNELWIREWFNYATEQVPLLYIEATKGLPSEKLIGLGYLSDDFYKNLDPRLQVQTPRVFYRRELEKNPFVVTRMP